MRRSAGLLSTAVAVTLTIATLPAPARAGAKYDYDPSADFSKYHTFRWIGEGQTGQTSAQQVPRAHTEQHPQLSPLVRKQIGEAVRTQLQGKGLVFAEQGMADLGVAIHTGKQREVVGYGWGPRYRGPRRVEVNEEGVLTIDLVDRLAKELIWRGSIAASIKEDPEKLHQQIESLVEKVLKNYPPPKK